ncbi:hypothetical protein [Nocardia cyriacigeorgica]|uniref:hypothetical protein n=1 Tax=Nocardia cyriacigeorgica TaxID=135487 RepID=UPI0013D2983B|nr:hypothetical protein [Nocardia cyriacigeorgica]
MTTCTGSAGWSYEASDEVVRQYVCDSVRWWPSIGQGVDRFGLGNSVQQFVSDTAGPRQRLGVGAV